MYKLIFILSVVLLFTIGCNRENTQDALPSDNNSDRFLQVENSSEAKKQNLSNEQIATHLANVATKVPNVNNATALIAGPYAVVGIDVDKDLDRSRVGTIKFSVSEALREDPYGKTAIVVADGDVNERIRMMADKMRQGHPVQGIVDEVAAIVGRYMPEFPVPREQPVEPDENKQLVPEGEKQELDDIQNDQSNKQKDKKD
ncbi:MULTISPECIES: YhcN/YlaJ family sporulation lipoprotein [unclassified Virgibacillus]|uniref:YhcN/YlaJ family sporulation lipoprotein n=1 Tax=unclassified Virgibacillus TaxID=2620237 RepID=UPI0024DEC9B7|nr:YhcN/YlaJ family sporulation lipoprotein [Virgibacillus sp. LDC-1]